MPYSSLLPSVDTISTQLAPLSFSVSEWAPVCACAMGVSTTGGGTAGALGVGNGVIDATTGICSCFGGSTATVVAAFAADDDGSAFAFEFASAWSPARPCTSEAGGTAVELGLPSGVVRARFCSSPPCVASQTAGTTMSAVRIRYVALTE